MTDENPRYRRFADRYESGEVPWDHELPPPEVLAFADDAAPGRALDLGCGYGRAAIYMAARGWRVTAIDFVPLAIAEARKRAAAAGVAAQVDFQVGSVLALDHLPAGGYDFALDVGCMHAFDQEQRAQYAAGVARALRPGALFMLFTRLAGPEDAALDEERDGPPRPQEADIRDALTPYFSPGAE